MTDRRWAWAEVDLGAIRHNVSALKALTPPGCLFMAVVKADGYGHGAIEVARTAVSAGADRLGVATVDEAVALRRAGLTCPIQLLSEPPETTVAEIIEFGLIPTVVTREFAVSLSRAASAKRVRVRYHLKVDTGMNRIGIRPEDAATFATMLGELSGIELEGTFTHFATADVAGDWEVTNQLKRFRTAVEAMRTERVDPGIVHAANSPATILVPDAHFSMVRCGIALYGLHPSSATESRVALIPAMSVKARATYVKRIGMGEGVSYGLTWHAGASAVIATLPLGYADGVHRILSGRFEVLTGGRRHPQVGRICMDQLMVDVSRGAVSRGDEFVIVGSQDGESIRMEDVAEQAGTINYEMACAFGMRLERIYR